MQLDIHFSKCQKNKQTKNSDVGVFTSLFFLMKLWLFLCLYQANGQMLGDTYTPSRCLTLENTQKICHKDQERLSSQTVGPPSPPACF